MTDDATAELERLRAALRKADDERLDALDELERLQSQHDVLENVLFGLEAEHEQARRVIEETQRELSASYERLSRLKAQQDEMLASLSEGLLDIGPDGLVGPNHSRAALELLGRETVAGIHFAELFPTTPRTAAQIREFIDVAINSEYASAEMIAAINPLREVDVEDARGRRTLSVRFNRFLSGGTRHLLVVISDRSTEQKLAAEIQERTRERLASIERAHAMLMAPPATVRDVAQQASSLAASLSHGLASKRRDELQVAAHAVKGDARAIGLEAVAGLMERLEDLLDRDAPHDVIKSMAEALDAEIDTDLALLDRLTALRETGTGRQANAILAVLAACAAREAEATGTLVDVKWSSELDASLDNELFQLLRSALVALVRNAVAHGAEPAEKRRLRGKPDVLCIQVAFKRADDEVVIVVRDDGRGVDWESLRREVVRRGFLRSDEAATLTRDDLEELLFADGMSTHDGVDASAGRGLGLAIVRQIAKQLHGQVVLESEHEVFTEVTLRVAADRLRRSLGRDDRQLTRKIS